MTSRAYNLKWRPLVENIFNELQCSLFTKKMIQIWWIILVDFHAFCLYYIKALRSHAWYNLFLMPSKWLWINSLECLFYHHSVKQQQYLNQKLLFLHEGKCIACHLVKNKTYFDFDDFLVHCVVKFSTFVESIILERNLLDARQLYHLWSLSLIIRKVSSQGHVPHLHLGFVRRFCIITFVISD